MLKRVFFVNVIWILKARGWRQKDLAERAKMSNSFVSDIVNGNANPSLRVMESIAKALEVPLTDLLNPNLDRFTTHKDVVGVDGNQKDIIPAGFEKITVILPKFKAFQVKKMADFFAQKNL